LLQEVSSCNLNQIEDRLKLWHIKLAHSKGCSYQVVSSGS